VRIALWVALGSGLGGLARAACVVASERAFGGDFPLGVLGVNTLGSVLIGFFAAVFGPGSRSMVGPSLRQFLMGGLCGGFTTFSLFSLQTLVFFQEGRPAAALLYSALTLGLALAGVWAGFAAGKALSR
jgi:fluoride exporter